MTDGLTGLLEPRSVAVVGASPKPGSVAGTILRGMATDFATLSDDGRRALKKLAGPIDWEAPVDFIEILKKMEPQLKGLSDIGKTKALSEIFNKRTASGISTSPPTADISCPTTAARSTKPAHASAESTPPRTATIIPVSMVGSSTSPAPSTSTNTPASSSPTRTSSATGPDSRPNAPD